TANVETLEADFVDPCECRQMNTRNVRHMDIVANTGTVGRRIVGAEYFQRRALAHCGSECQRNEMCLIGSVFTAQYGRSSCVEIAKADGAHSVGTMKPLQALLEHQLRFAVGVDWPQRVVFGNRNAARFAVSRSGRREHHSTHAMPAHDLEQGETLRDVVHEIL